jgi:hypothetical protein
VIYASAAAPPPASSPTTIEAIGTPLGVAISNVCVSLWVSPPMGVHHICNHRHRWSPSRELVVWSGPAWEDTPAAYL